MAPMRLTPRRSLGTEDVRNLQGLSGHDPLMWVAAESPVGWSLPAVYRWRPGHRGWWSPIYCGRAIPGSIGYQPSVPAGELQTNDQLN